MATKVLSLQKAIKRLDTKNVGLSIALLKEQVLQVVKEFPNHIAIRSNVIRNVVVCGMGGSALGADVLRSLYEPYLTVPFTIVNGYDLPGYVDRATLVVCISYSGTTEEPLSCLQQALQKKAPVFVICTGNAMAAQAKKRRIPAFIFTTGNNPSGQPRIGTGYTMTALYLLLKQLHLLKSGAVDLIAATRAMDIDPVKALALARAVHGQSLVIVAAGHLRGNAHIMSNQSNESGKVFAPYYCIPELNHHLLEGMGSLRTARNHWTIVFLDSRHYAPAIKKRLTITERIMKKQGFRTVRLSVGGSIAEEVLRLISFGSWLTYYEAILSGLDPATIPWVNYFKKHL
jgi:glucose/mannose-6-phosphate isomerase